MDHHFSYQQDDFEMRPMTYEYSEKYRLLRNREENRNRFFYNSVISVESQKAWFESYLSDPADYMFALFYQEEFAGGSAIYNVDFEKKTGEYGRLLVDKMRFPIKGLGTTFTEMASLIARKELGLYLLYSEVLTDNLPSFYSTIKTGFQHVETRLNDKGVEVFYIENLLVPEKDC